MTAIEVLVAVARQGVARRTLERIGISATWLVGALEQEDARPGQHPPIRNALVAQIKNSI